MKLKDKFALVTGASSGIGKAVAVALAKKGADVILTARNEKRLQETLLLVKEAGGKGYVIPADLSNKDAVFGLAEAVSNFVVDDLHIIVNVAAIWHGENEVYASKNLEDFSEEVVEDTLTVGILAPMLLVRALLPKMPAKAKIVNITGEFKYGGKGWLPYFVSKRALEDFTLGLSDELKSKNIQVNAISPSDVATGAFRKYFPQYVNDALSPNEVADFVVNLASDDKTTGKVFFLEKGKAPREGFHR